MKRRRLHIRNAGHQYQHVGRTHDADIGILSEAKGLDLNGRNLTEEQIRNSFSNLSAIWDVMYPVEKYKLIQTIISNITVFRDRIKIEYNKEAIGGLVHEQKA